MQSKIRWNRWLFLALASGVSVAGCWGCGGAPQAQPAASSLTFEGQVVRVVSPDDSVTALLKRYAPAWERKVGTRVDVVANVTGSDLTTYPDASAWVVRPAELPRWAAAEKLAPVPIEYKAQSGAYSWQGLLPLYREKLLRWAGETYALPILGDAPACFYRADLLADARHRQTFLEKLGRELRPPRTWDELADIAEYFYEHREPGKTVPSHPPLPVRTEDLDYLFYVVAAPYTRQVMYQGQRAPVSDQELFSFHYDLKTGEPRIGGPGFVYALRLLQRMQRCRPAEASPTPAQAFADGQAVVCVAEASEIARFRKKLPASSIGVCEVPGSSRWFGFRDGKEEAVLEGGNNVPYQGAHGWFAVVPRSAPHNEAAFALFAELSDRSAGTQVVFDPQWGGGAYREDHLKPSQNWLSFDLGDESTGKLREAIQQTVARPGLMNSAVRLRIPDQELYQRALVAEVQQALTANMEAQKALQKVVESWMKLDARKDRKQRTNEYLLSLGLSPIQ